MGEQGAKRGRQFGWLPRGTPIDDERGMRRYVLFGPEQLGAGNANVANLRALRKELSRGTSWWIKGPVVAAMFAYTAAFAAALKFAEPWVLPLVRQHMLYGLLSAPIGFLVFMPGMLILAQIGAHASARGTRAVLLRLGMCAHCFYDIRALTRAGELTVCPECGGVWRGVEG